MGFPPCSDMQSDDRIRRSVTNDTGYAHATWAMVMAVAMLEQPSPLKQISFAADEGIQKERQERRIG